MDTERGWSESPPDAAPGLAKPPGFPPPPPLPPGRAAGPEVAAPKRTAELPIPGLPVKEAGSPVAAPAANPALAVTEPHAVLPMPEPHPALTVTEPQRDALPVPGAFPPVERPPAFPTPPPPPVAPALPPALPMSPGTPAGAHPALVSPVGTRPAGAVPASSEAALKPPGFFARLRASRPSAGWLLIGGLVALLAFGGGLMTGRSLGLAKTAKTTGAEPEKREKKSAERPAPVAETKPAAARAATSATKPAQGGGAKRPFNAKLARSAVDRAAARAKGCRAARDPAGSVSATITFAPAGNVSNVTITTRRYAGTKTGSCVVSRLSDARVPAFTGSAATVKKSVAVR